MNEGRSVFAQLMDYLPLRELHRCVERYRGDHRVRSFSCLDQFLCMAFGQLSYRQSLRDVVVCLRSAGRKVYHLGIRGSISRSTLAEANELRDWRIYADFAQVLIHRARQLYHNEDFGVQIQETVYALDSSTIDLCLSLFPWALYKKTRGAIKLHTLLDLRGSIPSFISISHGKLFDALILDELVPEPGSFYVMDRGYIDYARLYRLTLAGAFFVVRARANTQFRRRYSHPVDKSTGLRSDQIGVLCGKNAFEHYPAPLRRIRFVDTATGTRFIFLTNHFGLPAATVAELYHSRWRIELFFKWIKQHLRIEAFYGTSENAVKTQIWIAVCTYALLAIAKKELGLPQNLYTISQVLSVNLFQKDLIQQLLAESDHPTNTTESANQLLLFDL